MLDTVRTYSTHWALKLILGMIALVFIFTFGSSSMGGQSEYAAKVNGEEIPFDQFQRLYQQQQDQRRNARLPDELQEQLLIGQVLDQLIEAELLRQFAKEQGLYVSKEELADEITRLPFLQDEQTQKFIGKQAYLDFLAERKIEVAEFEQDMREDLMVQKARKFIEGAAKVTPDEVKEEWKARNEKVNLQFLRVDAASLAESLKKDPVKDADIAEFESKFPGLVEQLYAEEKDDRWTTPAKAKMQQITVRKPAAGKGDADAAKRKAERVLELAKTDWKKAAELSEGSAWEKAGEPRELARREMPALVAEKVFAMKAGDPAEMVETPTSFVVVKVESSSPEKVTELDEKVKKEIIAEQIREKRAEEMVEGFAKEALAKLTAGETIEKVAASKNLAVKETGAFASRSQFPGIPEADASLVIASMKLEKPGEVLLVNGELPKVGDAYLIAVLKEHTKPDEKDFESQKTWVQASIERVRAAEIFRTWKAARVADSKVVRNERLLPST